MGISDYFTLRPPNTPAQTCDPKPLCAFSHPQVFTQLGRFIFFGLFFFFLTENPELLQVISLQGQLWLFEGRGLGSPPAGGAAISSICPPFGKAPLMPARCRARRCCCAGRLSAPLEEGAVALDKPLDFAVSEISQRFSRAKRARDSQGRLPTPKAGEQQRCGVTGNPLGMKTAAQGSPRGQGHRPGRMPSGHWTLLWGQANGLWPGPAAGPLPLLGGEGGPRELPPRSPSLPRLLWWHLPLAAAGEGTFALGTAAFPHSPVYSACHGAIFFYYFFLFFCFFLCRNTAGRA